MTKKATPTRTYNMEDVAIALSLLKLFPRLATLMSLEEFMPIVEDKSYDALVQVSLMNDFYARFALTGTSYKPRSETIEQTAVELKVDVDTVRTAIEIGTLAAVTVDNVLFISPEDIKDYRSEYLGRRRRTITT